uniref:Bestrophin homolog n=1 Tax=Parascaris univalens TaxID=6257 RepID=A0A915AH51_PARUN
KMPSKRARSRQIRHFINANIQQLYLPAVNVYTAVVTGMLTYQATTYQAITSTSLNKGTYILHYLPGNKS